VSKELTLSIIIPVYNEQSHIRSCLEAIAKQTEKPDEVIVVDNGSTDKSADIAKRFDFVRIVHEDKPSVLYARTAGYDAATSELIGRIDADTLLAPDWIQRAKEIMADPKIHAVTGPDAIYDMAFPRFTRWLHDILLRTAVAGGYHFLTGSNMVMRRVAWQRVKPHLCDDLTLFEDTDLALHMQRLGMTPSYSSMLWAGVSYRRFADRVPDFIRYQRRHSRTLAHHHFRAPGAYFAQAAYGLTYLISKPLIRFFNPKTRRFSLLFAFRRLDRRLDPMDGRVRAARRSK
jgi:glycosyltransferase involved in cell wall biosynthesis